MKKQPAIPQHIAIIMDGNRRWAEQHKLQIIMGHDKGTANIESLIYYAIERGIKYMTLWAFSSENWNRGKLEVTMLMEVFRNYLKGPVAARLIKRGVKLQILGDITAFPKDIIQGVEQILEDSKSNTTITINVALNYGGRQEVIKAVQQIVAEGVEEAAINEELISHYLYTKDQPDPDLIIRTGGEQRLSGYLPWQSIYSELYFTETLWPDFDAEEFQNALDEYARRERRFGK